MADELSDKAAQFASILTGILQASIEDCPRIEAVGNESGDHFTIRPEGDPPAGEHLPAIPLPRTGETDNRLLLRMFWGVTLEDSPDSSGVRHLRVEKSAYGLMIRPGPNKKSRPLVRVEYDRAMERGGTAKPSAHVHVHAESTELGWVRGSSGSDITRLEALHFPLGGRRFRPSIEDFCLFLDAEGLYTDWLPGWKPAMRDSRERFHEIQLRASVRANAEVAADELSKLGYSVTRDST